MGTLITTSTMIKLILGSALLALTAAEADPQLIYGAGLPYTAHHLAPLGLAPVGAVAHAPVVKAVVEKPAEVEHEVTAHTVPLAVGYHGYPHLGYYGKRSADAEPEADAYYGYYGYGLGYGGYRGYYGGRYGYPHGYYGKRSADAGLPYAGYPLVAAPAPVAAADEAVVAERKKREADPQVLLNGALPYAAAPLAAPLFATVGAVAHAPVVKSDVLTPAEVSHEVTALPVAAVGYHGYGYGGLNPYYG